MSDDDDSSGRDAAPAKRIPGEEIKRQQKTHTLSRVGEVEVEHGEAHLYAVDQDGNFPYLSSKVPRYFILHVVENARFDHNLKFGRPDEKPRYHVWSVENPHAIDEGADPVPNKIEMENIVASGPEKAAKRYAFDDF